MKTEIWLCSDWVTSSSAKSECIITFIISHYDKKRNASEVGAAECFIFIKPQRGGQKLTGYKPTSSGPLTHHKM